MDCSGRKAAILRILFNNKFLHDNLKLSKQGGFCHPVCFFLSTVCCILGSPASNHHWKPSAKIRLVMCSRLSDFIRGWLGSTGHLQGSLVSPTTTHAAFSLWFCQSWMFGFGFSVLDVCLEAELLFVVHFPPSKHLSHLSWPDKYLQEEKSHSPCFPDLSLSNTEESLSISIAPQKEWNHLEKVRKEVLGGAKNRNQVSQAYKLCLNSQAICCPCPLLWDSWFKG